MMEGFVNDLNSEWRHIRGLNNFNSNETQSKISKKMHNRHGVKLEMNLPKAKLPTKGKREYVKPKYQAVYLHTFNGRSFFKICF